MRNKSCKDTPQPHHNNHGTTRPAVQKKNFNTPSSWLSLQSLKTWALASLCPAQLESSFLALSLRYGLYSPPSVRPGGEKEVSFNQEDHLNGCSHAC